MKAWKIAVAVSVGLLVLLGVVWLLGRAPSGGIGVGKPPSVARGMHRLATFNVEGLFDAIDDPKLSGENDDTPSSEEHLAAIAEAIRLIDADILALEDVESLEAVQWFRDTRLVDMGYEHVASLDVGHERGVQDAVLSRFPIDATKAWPTLKLGGNHPSVAGDQPNAYAGQPLRFRRSPQMVRVVLPDDGSRSGGTLTIFVVEHKGGDRFDYWREAEAKAILRLAHDVGMHQRVVILGSFHADPKAASIEAYLAGGFSDVFDVKGEPDRWATETSGDRTDFILANRVALGDLDAEAGFVLGGALAELRAGAMQDATHLPVVVGLRGGDE